MPEGVESSFVIENSDFQPKYVKNMKLYKKSYVLQTPIFSCEEYHELENNFLILKYKIENVEYTEKLKRIENKKTFNKFEKRYM